MTIQPGQSRWRFHSGAGLGMIGQNTLNLVATVIMLD